MSDNRIDDEAEWKWAVEQFEAIAPYQDAIRAFDESEDGARYRKITGMTMWENLAADSLPATADEDDDEDALETHRLEEAWKAGVEAYYRELREQFMSGFLTAGDERE